MKIYSFCNDEIPHWEIPSNSYNKEFTWWPSDSKERYNPIGNLYGPDDITYKTNSKGFRCDEFNIPSEKRIVFLGCSFTFGVGLPLHHTWSYILLELIKKETGYNIPYWNLALGGIGVDALVRLFYHYGLKLKPQLTFALFPEYRRELYRESSNFLTPHLINAPDDNFNKFPYMVDSRIIQYETEKNLCFLDLMIKSIDSKLIHNNWTTPGILTNIYKKFQLCHNAEFIFDQKARDRMHSGYEANLKYATQIFEQYKDIIIESLKD